MARQLDVALPQRQLFSGGDTNLHLHEVKPGDHFGHRMFDLQTRVHFNKEKLATLIQKFKSARAFVSHFATRLGTTLGGTHTRARVEQGRGRFFDDFLVAALHRAIAVTQIKRVLVLIGDDLNLDVARTLQEFFHINHGVIECRLRFGTCGVGRIKQCCFGMHHAHAAPAPPT